MPIPQRPFRPSPTPERISDRLAAVNDVAARPLWDGYGKPGETRSPGEVETHEIVGRCYSDLAAAWRPKTVVEFGTAFGVSGMWWLAGSQYRSNLRLGAAE